MMPLISEFLKVTTKKWSQQVLQFGLSGFPVCIQHGQWKKKKPTKFISV